MGQYYNAVLKINEDVTSYYHQVDGEYMMAKLMEHSYWANPFVLAIASKMFRTKCQLAWVGDYADADDFNWDEEMKDAHNNAREDLVYNGFRLEGKLFINHTKKIFIDLDEYREKLKKQDMIINPVSMLTAVGNGKGGGDYRSGLGYEIVGEWAWDIVEITDQDIFDWSYDYENSEWNKELKEEFKEYKDVTEDSLFVECD